MWAIDDLPNNKIAMISEYFLSLLRHKISKKINGHKCNHIERGYYGLGVSGCYTESLMMNKCN